MIADPVDCVCSMSLSRVLFGHQDHGDLLLRYLSRSRAICLSSTFLASRILDPESVFGDVSIFDDVACFWISRIYAILAMTRSDRDDSRDRSYIRMVSSSDPLVV
jgi:hypothetical protein